MRIVAVLNQKGGVGKTTTAVNLGAALALRGRRVLLIDSDPQGNLTDHLGLDPQDADATLYDVLTDSTSIADATVPTKTKGLFVVPSEPDLTAAESELAGEIGREFHLKKALERVPEGAYEWVLIDCPPSLGLLSLNAMAGANELLITLQTEYFALKGLEQLDKVKTLVQEHLNPSLKMLGILPTLVNPVTILSREVIAEIREHYGDVVLRARIRQNVSLAEAPSRGTHVFAYRPGCPGADDYLRLADEVEGVKDSRASSRATKLAIAERRRLKEVPIDVSAPTPSPSAPTRNSAPARSSSGVARTGTPAKPPVVMPIVPPVLRPPPDRAVAKRAADKRSVPVEQPPASPENN